jgi:iron(III) transport system ATP-binding protein
VRVHLRSEIRSLQRKLGVTTIMVTHDQEEALSVADRIVVMNHGRIEQVGTPMQVYREPASPSWPTSWAASTWCRHGRKPAAACAWAQSFDCPHEPGRAARSRSTCGPRTCWRGPSSRGDSNVFDAVIDKIEFLGSYCLVRVTSPALGEHRLTVYLSLNFLAEQQLEVGGRCRCACCPSACGCS